MIEDALTECASTGKRRIIASNYERMANLAKKLIMVGDNREWCRAKVDEVLELRFASGGAKVLKQATPNLGLILLVKQLHFGLPPILYFDVQHVGARIEIDIENTVTFHGRR